MTRNHSLTLARRRAGAQHTEPGLPLDLDHDALTKRAHSMSASEKRRFQASRRPSERVGAPHVALEQVDRRPLTTTPFSQEWSSIAEHLYVAQKVVEKKMVRRAVRSSKIKSDRLCDRRGVEALIG